MSFDIFVQAFEKGKPRFYPRNVLVKAFGSFCDMSDPTWWTVADSFAVIQLNDAPEVDGFGVNRPPGDGHPLWPALLNVLRETSSVLYWPGGGPVITDTSVEATLPRGMIKALGPAKVATTVEEIGRLIEES
jgi:hypothetical protein